MTESIQRSVVLPVPARAVWAAITEADALSAWFGGRVEVDALPGGQVVFHDDGRVRRAVIVDLEPERRLAFRWLPPHRRVGFVWGSDETPAATSGEVELTLTPAGAGTRLTVVEKAPDRVGARALSRI